MAAPQAPYIGKQGKLTLDEAVFGERFHGPLVHEAVRADENLLFVRGSVPGPKGSVVEIRSDA